MREVHLETDEVYRKDDADVSHQHVFLQDRKIKDGKVVETATLGGTFILEHKNLKGFGDFSDNLFFGTKDAELNGTVVKDAPWVSQISTENNEII